MIGKSAIQAFKSDAIETASQEKLLTLLLDRLCLDIERARIAYQAGNASDASGHLIHAQNIVSALNQALDSGWANAKDFASLYNYLYEQLVKANTSRDLQVVEECLEVASPLRDLWKEVAAKAASEKAGPVKASF